MSCVHVHVHGGCGVCVHWTGAVKWLKLLGK